MGQGGGTESVANYARVCLLGGHLFVVRIISLFRLPNSSFSAKFDSSSSFKSSLLTELPLPNEARLFHPVARVKSLSLDIPVTRDSCELGRGGSPRSL